MNKKHLIAIEVIAVLVLYEVLFEISNTSIFLLFVSIYNTKYKSNLFCLGTRKTFKTSLLLSIYACVCP